LSINKIIDNSAVMPSAHKYFVVNSFTSFEADFELCYNRSEKSLSPRCLFC